MDRKKIERGAGTVEYVDTGGEAAESGGGEGFDHDEDCLRSCMWSALTLPSADSEVVPRNAEPEADSRELKARSGSREVRL